jgi:siroheme synthase-like protein
MAYFPLFVNLEGKLCVVIGGGAVAARKAQTLLDFGARLNVAALKAGEAMKALALRGSLTLKEAPYRGPEDLTGAFLVVAATDKGDLNKRIIRDALAAGIHANAADDPEEGTFFFPALVRRGELVAGISSSGACPRLASRLKMNLDTLWPADLGESLENLREERRRLRESLNPQETVRRLDLLIDRILGEG